jgi:RimJ/RimL family protein N-acetyltransferase
VSAGPALNTSGLAYRPVAAADADTLIAFLTGEDWPFHYHLRPPLALVQKWIDTGWFLEPTSLHLWVMREDVHIGLVGLFDLDDIEDGAPQLGLRVTAGARGLGVGTAAVRWLCGHAFARWPRLERIFAETRADNTAMQRLLVRCGFAKEMHARRAWHSEAGERFDALGYGLLREDWQAGSVTPVLWTGAP